MQLKTFRISTKSGLPQWISSKVSACNAGDTGWIRKTPCRRKWQPLQYSCLGNLTDREAWCATVHGVTKSQTWLSDWTSMATEADWREGEADVQSSCISPYLFAAEGKFWCSQDKTASQGSIMKTQGQNCDTFHDCLHDCCLVTKWCLTLWLHGL